MLSGFMEAEILIPAILLIAVDEVILFDFADVSGTTCAEGLRLRACV